MSLFSEKLLRTFCKVVEHGGFSGAQYDLGISQPAISNHIRDLEIILGYRLCERGRSGFHLTDRGQQTYERCRKMLIQFEDFESDLLGLRNTLKGSLRIGVVDAHLTNPALPISTAINNFFDRENDIQFQFHVAPPNELELELINGTLHLAIGPFTQKIEGLSYQYLSSEHHSLYCGTSHPLFNASSDKITPQIIEDHQLCLRSYNTHSGLELLKGKGQTALVSNMEAQASLILSGKFLGALPDHYAKRWVTRGDLKALKHKDLSWTSDFHLATRQSPAQREIIKLFTQDFLNLISLETSPD